MQKLYSDSRLLDASSRASYGLTEEIMMENAACALEQYINSYSKTSVPVKNVVILCGGGNNGADGYALSRRLRFNYVVTVIQCAEPSSQLCRIQADRAEKCGVMISDINHNNFQTLNEAHIIIDCIFGSGFHGELAENIQTLINDINTMDCYKIACDVPSGIDSNGCGGETAFSADLTVTMGSLKLCLYSDHAKDFCGRIVCANLGVSRRLYENSSSKVTPAAFLLEESDMNLPYRTKKCVNKGTFGHAVFAAGEKPGAAVIAASAALRFGAGLVSVITDDKIKVPPELLISNSIPQKYSSICFGMGLGIKTPRSASWFDLALSNPEIPCVADADVFYDERILELLETCAKNTVLTPHPKEFASLLKLCGLGDYQVRETACGRPSLMEDFCRKYPGCVLLVKGANEMTGTFDGKEFKLFVNPYGMPCLAKAGSGDVLSGMTAALLAQKYSPLEAALTASLAHSFASRKIECDYSMTPDDLIKAAGSL